MLEYYTSTGTLYAWLVKRDTIQIHALPIPVKTLEQEVNTLLLPNIATRPRAAAPVITLPIGGGHTTESSTQERDRNRTQFTQKTEALSQKLLTPLLKSITTQRLVIVPHGVLHKLPFAALSDAHGPLIERHSLTVLPAMSVLEYVVKKRNPDQGRLLALATRSWTMYRATPT